MISESLTNIRTLCEQWFSSIGHTHNQYLTSHQDISGKEDTDNKVTTLSSSNTDTQYPSAKCVYDSINDFIDVVYPVGSIYMSVNSTSPQVLFGGRWEQLKDRFLLGAGDSYSNGSTGGSKDAVVVNHNHTQNSHNHGTRSSEYNKFLTYSGTNIAVNSAGRRWTQSDGSVFYVYEPSGDGGIDQPTKTGSTTAINNSTGVSGNDKNMPPYLTVFMWKRIS